MHKTTLLILIILSLSINLCRGQIGESKVKLAHRYGEPSPCDKMLTAPYDKLVDDYSAFQHDKLTIYAGFKDGKAVLFMYQKRDKSSMSQEDVFAVLRVATIKPDWVLLSGKNPNPRWRLGDSSAYAYYYPEPDSPGAPARFVRIHTARLDAIYAKLRQDNPTK